VRDASLADLLEALRGVLARLKPPPAHAIFAPGLSVADCVERILARFALGRGVEFAEVFSAEAARGEVIVTFLALLELIRLKVVRAVQHDRFGPIQLDLAVADLAEARERARDMGQAGGWRGVEVVDGSEPGDRA
jgi:segregation and condensation protein A